VLQHLGMCVVVRNRATGLFLEKLGAWTQEPFEAHGFKNPASAESFVARNEIGDVEIVWRLQSLA
jgi:hypothetical protein